MNTKLVIWSYDRDVTVTDEVKADHLEYLKRLLDDGSLLAAGPRGDVAGGVLLFREASEDDLSHLLAEDPFTPAGVIATTTIVDWNAGLGAFAATV